MDELQIILSIVIPLIVSLIVWTLTYIIPYISPNWISNGLIKFTRDDPSDPVGIGLIISQFLKYDDWKRLNASKRIQRMFIKKIREIEKDNEQEWSELVKKVIKMPLKDALMKLDLVLVELRDKNYEKKYNIHLTSPDVIEHFEKQIESLEDYRKKYYEILKQYNNAIIWDQCTIPPKFIERYNKENYVLSLKEIELIDFKYIMLDKNGKMSTEEFLNIKGHNTPKRQTDDEIIAIFNDVIFYIDYPHSKFKKDKLIYRLSLGLSDHERSQKTLNGIISEVESQILMKDYNDIVKRHNL